jgi:hypothetical protein
VCAAQAELWVWRRGDTTTLQECRWVQRALPHTDPNRAAGGRRRPSSSSLFCCVPAFRAAFVPSCLRAFVPSCLRATVPPCHRAFVPPCLLLRLCLVSAVSSPLRTRDKPARVAGSPDKARAWPAGVAGSEPARARTWACGRPGEKSQKQWRVTRHSLTPKKRMCFAMTSPTAERDSSGGRVGCFRTPESFRPLFSVFSVALFVASMPLTCHSNNKRNPPPPKEPRARG